MCLHVCPSPGNLDPHTGTCVSPIPVCPLRFRVPVCMCRSVCPAGPRACVRACAHAREAAPPPHHPRLSAALVTLAQRKVMTNARYQRTRPMTNGRAPEQPHYAVITEDGWSSAPHPHPYPPSPVTGAHTAPPSREGAEPLAGPPITAGPRSPGPGRGAGSPRGCPRRRNKATRSGGSRRHPGHPARPRPGHAAVHTNGLHTRQPPASLHGAPAAPVQAQPPRHGSTDTCFSAVRGHTMCSPDPGTHPQT